MARACGQLWPETLKHHVLACRAVDYSRNRESAASLVDERVDRQAIVGYECVHILGPQVRCSEFRSLIDDIVLSEPA